jgi:hypothetical protein
MSPVKQSHRQRYGYPLWLPLVATLLVVAFPLLIIVAFATGEWRWLGGNAFIAAIAWVFSGA